jgi:uncharacterized tellurite resistance protein B-like protein
MSYKNEVIQQRVIILSNRINDFLIEQCEKENYSAAELYMTVVYLKAQFEKALGKEFVKQMEQAFTIVDMSTASKC